MMKTLASWEKRKAFDWAPVHFADVIAIAGSSNLKLLERVEKLN